MFVIKNAGDLFSDHWHFPSACLCHYLSDIGPLTGLSKTKDSHALDYLISPLHTSLFSLLVLDVPYTNPVRTVRRKNGANSPLLLDYSPVIREMMDQCKIVGVSHEV